MHIGELNNSFLAKPKPYIYISEKPCWLCFFFRICIYTYSSSFDFFSQGLFLLTSSRSASLASKKERLVKSTAGFISNLHQIFWKLTISEVGCCENNQILAV